jgi:hypothetical protein
MTKLDLFFLSLVNCYENIYSENILFSSLCCRRLFSFLFKTLLNFIEFHFFQEICFLTLYSFIEKLDAIFSFVFSIFLTFCIQHFLLQHSSVLLLNTTEKLSLHNCVFVSRPKKKKHRENFEKKSMKPEKL